MMLRHGLIGLAVIVASVTMAESAITRGDMETAARLIESKRAGEAYQLLTSKHEAGRSGSQELFLLGIASKASGRCSEAVTYFEQVLARDPGSHRAKLEMAECVHQAGDGAKARQLLLDVKASNPPERVVQNIDRFLAVIGQAEQSQSAWRVRGSVGIVYDSNVRQGTSAAEVFLYGLPFTLSQDARKRGDMAYQAKAEIDHVARLSNGLSWQSNFTLGWRDYFRMNTYDTLSFNASTGPVWQVNPKTIVSVPIIASGSRLENGQAYYSVLTGVAPQLRYVMSPFVTFNIETTVGQKHYRDNAQRDGSYLAATPSFDFRVGTAGKLTAGVQFARENSGVGYFANDAATLNLSYLHQISPSLALMMYGSGSVPTRCRPTLCS